jgi:hypothetical protein
MLGYGFYLTFLNPENPMKSILQYFIATLFCVFSITVFAETPRYAIVVDAGSSGSRLYVFKYDKSATVGTIEDIFSTTTTPGLSHYANQPERAGESLKPLFDHALQFLQQNNLNPQSVPVKILATAGMRMLPSTQQEAVYTQIKTYLKNQYPFTLEEVKTISGKMEGLYGWLDVNYLLGNFQHKRATVGIIEMGGASTQIAFALGDHSKKTHDKISLALGHQRYTVFSKSFLGLGQDQAYNTMTQDIAAPDCHPPQATFGDRIGQFNRATCATIYAGIIDKNRVAQYIPPLQNTPFIAYSGIYYAYDFLNIIQTPDQASLQSRIENVCYRTWSQLQKDYPQIAEKYLLTYCANSVYFDQLLYNTYHLQGSQLTVTNQIDQKNLNWARGVILYSLAQYAQ